MEIMIEKIKKWICSTQKEPLESFETGFSSTFGFIKMRDGRKAQIKVSLELDEDMWEDA